MPAVASIIAATAPHRPLRLAILQRVCPQYRVGLFRALTSDTRIEARLFIGDDIPNSKVGNARDLRDIAITRIPTRFLRLGRRVLPWHTKLIKELQAFQPDVILCEGESHFLGYLQAILFRAVFSRKTALMHWCFISLPGDPVGGRGFRAYIKAFFRRFFDAFVVYSSFSKEILRQLGEPPEKVFVATNVCDTERCQELARGLPKDRASAKSQCNIDRRFTVLYLGTIDAAKRPELLLEIAPLLPADRFQILVLGGGPMLAELSAKAEATGLKHLKFLGKVTENVPLYYRAADVMIVPGRGGIVFSEALVFGLPVIVHQADGTEHDLVIDGVTGIRVNDGSAASFAAAITQIAENPETSVKMRQAAEQLAAERFSTSRMVDAIIAAAEYAQRSRGEAK